jgi:hypothetical protein
MPTRALAAPLGILLLLGANELRSAPAPAAGAAAPVQTAAAAPPATADAAAAKSAKVWIGRYDEYAEYLRTAAIEKLEAVPVGVTKPERALFVPGGIAGRAAVKHLPPGNRSGFWESYKSEIAAYELDRLLGMDMVPPTVERRVGHDLASVQLWVEGCRLLKELDQSKCPSPSEWAKQVCRQRVFDNLVANIDRNQGNLLVDEAWNMILIDHSRAFASDRMPFEKDMARVDRAFFDKLKALDEAALMQHVRPWLMGDREVRGLLKRRDKIVARFEALARERGEAVVFPFPPSTPVAK